MRTAEPESSSYSLRSEPSPGRPGPSSGSTIGDVPPLTRAIVRLLSTGLLASATSAQVGLTVEGPGRPVEPGSVRVFGTAIGKAPFRLRLNEKIVEVDEDGSWESTLELGLGDHSLEFRLTDATETESTSSHSIVALVLGEFTHRPVLRVSNVEHLIAALGSRRIIVVSPGEYDLSTRFAASLPTGVERRPGTGNLALVNLHNLDIVGSADLTTKLLTSKKGGTALVLVDCERVNFTTLKIAHEPATAEDETVPDKSMGGILSYRGTYNTWLRGCELSGEGVAISATTINAFVCQDSTIRDCTGGVLMSKNSKHMTFTNSKFLNNGRGRPGDVCVKIVGRIKRDIDFVRVIVRGNQPEPGLGLFDIAEGQDLVNFLEGEIVDNDASSLRSGAGKKLFKTEKAKVTGF